MTEILNGEAGRKFCVLTKYANNFHSQDEFTEWELSVKSDDIFVFLGQADVLVCYEIKDAEFSMI